MGTVEQIYWFDKKFEHDKLIDLTECFQHDKNIWHIFHTYNFTQQLFIYHFGKPYGNNTISISRNKNNSLTTATINGEEENIHLSKSCLEEKFKAKLGGVPDWATK